MSEQEKTTGGTGASGQSVVMVESGARHKQSYRPTELQDDALPDLHHKRSRAPAVPSMTEDLKAATETSGTKERKESERAMSSEKHKSNAAKKLSSNTKRRGSSPEAITLAPLEVETKRATLTPPQPIPAQVESMASMGSDATGKFDEDKKDDDDSIKEEIAELRTSVVAKPSSEWTDHETDGGNNTAKNEDNENISLQEKKDVTDDENIPQQEVNNSKNLPQEQNEHSREDKNVLQKETEDSPDEVNLDVKELGVRSYAWTVERKASIGPYFQSTPSIGGPSGITICIPKVPIRKSRRGIDEDLKTMPSVINITVSKKNIVHDFITRSNNNHGKDKLNLKIGDAPNATFFSALRGRINDMREKIRNTLNI